MPKEVKTKPQQSEPLTSYEVFLGELKKDLGEVNPEGEKEKTSQEAAEENAKK